MARRTPISQRIGQGILGALEAYGAAQSWRSEREQSEAQERYLNAQAQRLEAQQRWLDELARREVEGRPTGQRPLRPATPPITSQVAPRLVPSQQELHERLMGPLPKIAQGPIGRPPVASSLMSAFEAPSIRVGPSAPTVTPDQVTPSPLLQSIQQTGLPRSQAPAKYGFIQSGTPQARQAKGDGTDLVSRLPDESFAGPRPSAQFESRVGRGAYEMPPQFDTWMDQMRTMAGAAGVDTSTYPARQTPEWQIFQPFITNYVQGIADMLTASPKTLKYTNSAGQTATTYVNIDRLLNAGALRAAQDIPAVGQMLKDMGVFDQMGPMVGMDSMATNHRQIETNATTDRIIQDSASKALDEHNPLKRAMNDNPLGPKFSTGGFFGPSITTTEISEQSRRVLENMVPIANVAQQVGDLALDLNTQETRFLAALQGVGQNVDTWFGTPWWTPKETRVELGLDARPLSEAQINALWDRINPESNVTERARGLDRIRQLTKLRHAYAGIFAEMGGERGRKTEEDVRRALQMVPGAGETVGLTRSMLDTLYTNMINTYDSIVSGFTVTLGRLYTDLQGETAIEGGLMGGIWRRREEMRAAKERQHILSRDVRDPDQKEDTDQRNGTQRGGTSGRGAPRTQNR